MLGPVLDQCKLQLEDGKKTYKSSSELKKQILVSVKTVVDRLKSLCYSIQRTRLCYRAAVQNIPKLDINLSGKRHAMHMLCDLEAPEARSRSIASNIDYPTDIFYTVD